MFPPFFFAFALVSLGVEGEGSGFDSHFSLFPLFPFLFFRFSLYIFEILTCSLINEGAFLTVYEGEMVWGFKAVHDQRKGGRKESVGIKSLVLSNLYVGNSFLVVATLDTDGRVEIYYNNMPSEEIFPLSVLSLLS